MADEANILADSNPPKKPGIMTLVKAVGALSILVLIQVVAVSTLVPSAAETEHLAERLVAAESAVEPAEADSATDENSSQDAGVNQDMLEVSLGSYHVVTYDVDTGSSLNVDFDLYGTVLSSEEGEFLQLYTVTENRLHEQINIAVRGAEVTDLSDPDLDLLKRRILEKTNRTLGKPLVHEAIFSKFSFIER